MKKIYNTKFVFILVVILMTNLGNAAPRSPRSSKHTSGPTEKQITKRSVNFWNNLNTMFTSNSYQELSSPWDSTGGPSVYYESNVLGLNDDNRAGINSIPSVKLDYMWPEQELRHISYFEEVPQKNNDRALILTNIGKDDTFNYILENDCDYDMNGGAGGSINDVYWNFPPRGIDESIFNNFYLVPDPIEKSNTIVENEVTTVQPISTDKPAEEEEKTPNVSIFNCFSDSGQKELVEKALSNKNDEYLVLLIKRNPFTDQKEPETVLQKPQSSQKELANKNIVETTTASPVTVEEITYPSETVKLPKTTTVFPLIAEKSTEIAKNVEEVAEADDKKEVLIAGEPKETIVEDDSSKFVASTFTIVGTEKPLEISINDSSPQLETDTINDNQSFKAKSFNDSSTKDESPTWKEVENDQKNHSTAVVAENVAEEKVAEGTPSPVAVSEVKEEVSHVPVLEPAEVKSSDIAVTVIKNSGKPDIGNFSDSQSITESENEVRSEVTNSDTEMSPKVEINGVPDVGSDGLNDGIPDVDRDSLNEISITSNSTPIEMKSIGVPVNNRDSEDDGVKVAENEPKLPTVIENTEQNTSMSSVDEQIKSQESGPTAVLSDVDDKELDIGTTTGSSLNELENSASDTGIQVPSEKSDLPIDEPEKDAAEVVQ